MAFRFRPVFFEWVLDSIYLIRISNILPDITKKRQNRIFLPKYAKFFISTSPSRLVGQ